jgi:hypothetical protein
MIMSPDTRRDDLAQPDDPGTKDFWFGVVGLGVIALAAIVTAIISSL